MRLAACAALALFACTSSAAEPGPGLDARAPFDASADGLCPPAAPYGVAEGDRLPDPPLLDCDGNLHSLHELCEKKASWQFHFASW